MGIENPDLIKQGCKQKEVVIARSMYIFISTIKGQTQNFIANELSISQAAVSKGFYRFRMLLRNDNFLRKCVYGENLLAS